MPSRVALLLGKPPKPGTLLAEVADELGARGCAVTIRLPHEGTVDVAELAEQDLVVHRGLHDSLAPLLAQIDGRGIGLCNPWAGDRMLRDRRAWRDTLARSGVPVPSSTQVERWAEVLAGAVGQEVVVKVLAGPGRGARVVSGTHDTLAPKAPFPGPYLVEPRLESDGTDRKLYVAGTSVRGLLKSSTLAGPHTTSGVAFDPEPAQVLLALRVGQVLGLHVFGVDLVQTPAGPVVVDVNAFPGFRGVDGAGTVVADHLLTHVAR